MLVGLCLLFSHLRHDMYLILRSGASRGGNVMRLPPAFFLPTSSTHQILLLQYSSKPSSLRSSVPNIPQIFKPLISYSLIASSALGLQHFGGRVWRHPSQPSDLEALLTKQCTRRIRSDKYAVVIQHLYFR